MLADQLGRRIKRLASRLYALKQAKDQLTGFVFPQRVTFLCLSDRLLAAPSVRSYARGCPRIYHWAYSPLDDPFRDNSEFSFLSPLPTSPEPTHLFLASHSRSEQHVLVKLVQDNYGVQVHKTLARAGLAPILYGFAHRYELPTAYVMEYLPPPNTDTGWITLHEYTGSQQMPPEKRPELIKASLDNILRVLSTNSMVRGDLRPNNIMIHVDPDMNPVLDATGVVLKVVDFDWAGTQGQVRYPVLRNDAWKWPAKINEPIVAGMDRQLVDDWWNKMQG